MKLAHDPLVDPEVLKELENELHHLSLDTVSLSNWQMDSYLDSFTNWIKTNSLHQVLGLEQYPHRAYTCGTVESIAAFIYRHCRKRRIRFSRAEFVLTKIASNSINADWMFLEDEELKSGDALVISFPFSGNGSKYPGFDELIDQCNHLGIPVLLDIAYFGISQGLTFDLTRPCITDVVCSLSKPLSVQLRLGIRYTRELHDDVIQSSSDLRIMNRIAAQLGMELLKKFPSEYIISKYYQRYLDICAKNNLTPTNTITLALGNEQDHKEFFRNGYYRICVTDELLQRI